MSLSRSSNSYSDSFSSDSRGGHEEGYREPTPTTPTSSVASRISSPIPETRYVSRDNIGQAATPDAEEEPLPAVAAESPEKPPLHRRRSVVTPPVPVPRPGRQESMRDSHTSDEFNRTENSLATSMTMGGVQPFSDEDLHLDQSPSMSSEASGLAHLVDALGDDVSPTVPAHRALSRKQSVVDPVTGMTSSGMLMEVIKLQQVTERRRSQIEEEREEIETENRILQEKLEEQLMATSRMQADQTIRLHQVEEEVMAKHAAQVAALTQSLHTARVSLEEQQTAHDKEAAALRGQLAEERAERSAAESKVDELQRLLDDTKDADAKDVEPQRATVVAAPVPTTATPSTAPPQPTPAPAPVHVAVAAAVETVAAAVQCDVDPTAATKADVDSLEEQLVQERAGKRQIREEKAKMANDLANMKDALHEKEAMVATLQQALAKSRRREEDLRARLERAQQQSPSHASSLGKLGRTNSTVAVLSADATASNVTADGAGDGLDNTYTLTSANSTVKTTDADALQRAESADSELSPEKPRSRVPKKSSGSTTRTDSARSRGSNKAKAPQPPPREFGNPEPHRQLHRRHYEKKRTSTGGLDAFRVPPPASSRCVDEEAHMKHYMTLVPVAEQQQSRSRGGGSAHHHVSPPAPHSARRASARPKAPRSPRPGETVWKDSYPDASPSALAGAPEFRVVTTHTHARDRGGLGYNQDDDPHLRHYRRKVKHHNFFL